MAEKIGIGIIGTGTIAQHHLVALRDSTVGRAVAVFDVLADRAEATATEFGIPYIASSVADLLARSDVDAVIVCTPPFAHRDPTIQALDAGKHVLCEKPFALEPADAERMVRTADRVGKYLACGSGRVRFTTAQTQARKMLDAGDLGDVYHVRSTSLRFRGRPGHHILKQSAWFLDHKRAGGGVIMDGSVYTIDSVLWLMGNPRVLSVTAAMKQFTEEPPPKDAPQDVEDHAVIMLQCEGGRSAVIESAWVSNMDDADGVLIFGTKAGLKLNPTRMITPERVDRAAVNAPPHVGDDVFRPLITRVLPFERTGAFPMMGEISVRFCESLLKGEQPMTSGRDALVVTQVIDAAYRSVRDQRAVAIA